MLRKFNQLSLVFGVPGLLLQTGAVIYQWPAGQEAIGVGLVWLGTVALLVGLAFYAKAKGWSYAWGLLGLASVIGAIVLGVFPDRSKLTPP